MINMTRFHLVWWFDCHMGFKIKVIILCNNLLFYGSNTYEWVYLMRPMQKKLLGPQWQASRINPLFEIHKMGFFSDICGEKGTFLFDFLRGLVFTNWSLKYIIVKLLAYRFSVSYSYSRYVMFSSNYALLNWPQFC